MNILELVAGISLDSSEMDGDLESFATRAVAKGKLIADAIGTVASKGFGLLKNAVTSSIETGKSFDTAISQVAATTGQTVDQIGDLKAAAEEMGATTKFTATEAAEGINILAMAGMSASDILTEDASGATLLSTTLSLASAGAMSMESSATYLTASLKGFSTEGKSAAYYADLMAKGATLANTDVSGLGEALSGVSATASAYGQASDSVTLSLLKLAEANVTGSNASTSLKAAMKDLYTPTDTAAIALKELGVSAYNADGSARDFNDVVDSLSGALGSMSAQQKNAYLNTIFGIQGLDAYNKMAGVSTEKTNSFKEALANASGSAAEQAATQLDNLEGSMTLLDSAMDGLKLSFYSMFSDKLKAGIDLISESVTILTEGLSSGGLLGIIKSLGGVADNAIQKLLKSLSSVTKLPLVSWFKQLKKVGSDAFSGVAGAISELLKVFDPVVQALKNLIGVTEDSRTEMQKSLDKMSAAKAIFETIKAVISAVGKVVKDLISGPLTLLAQMFANKLLTAIDAFSGVATVLIDWVQSLPIAEWANKIQDSLSGAFSSIINAISPLIEVVGQIKEYFVGLFENFATGETVAGSLNAALQVLNGIIEGISAAIEIAGIVISTVISTLTQVIQQVIADAQTDGTLINEIITGIQTVIETAFIFISDTWNNVLVPVFSEIITWLSENIQPMFETAFTAIQTVVETVFTAIQTVWNDILSPVFSAIYSVIVNDLQPGFETAWNIIYTYVTEVFEGIKMYWDTILEPVFTALIESVRDNIGPTVETVFTSVKEFVVTAFNGIVDTWENHLRPCWEAIRNFINNILLPAFTSIVRSVRNFVQPVFEALGTFLKTVLKPTFDSVFKTVSSSVKLAFSAITVAYNSVLKPLFDGMIDFITNVFTGNWKGAWQTLVDTFGTVFNGIIEYAKIPINAVIGLINNAIGFIESGLNSIIGAMNKISVSIPDWVPGIGGGTFGVNISPVSFSRLDQLEKGGILRKGQKGYLEGAGDEAVVPLEKSEGWLNALAEKINGNGKGSQPITININGYSKDKEELADEIADELSKRMANNYSRQRRVFA